MLATHRSLGVDSFAFSLQKYLPNNGFCFRWVRCLFPYRRSNELRNHQFRRIMEKPTQNLLRLDFLHVTGSGASTKYNSPATVFLAGPVFSFKSISSAPRFLSVPPVASSGAVVPSGCGIFKVGDFMIKKEDLHVAKPTTSVDEALEMLVEHRITGLPVVDDDWNLVGLVSDYDLLALNSISGEKLQDNNMFPQPDSSWKVFNSVQKLLTKTSGKVVGDLMSSVPLVVRETTNLEDAARLLLDTRYRRLPVVDSDRKLVGIITRGNVVKAALQIRQEFEVT